MAVDMLGWDAEPPGGPSVFGGGSSAALTITHLTQYLGTLIREDEILQDVWVRGEISNCTRAASGHVYLSLKDDGACVGCVLWRSMAGRLKFRPESGMQVVAHGRLTLYAPRGQYQLELDDLQPDGLGALHLALEQTRAKLLAEGLFDGERKRPLPAFPRTVAVVTSLSGAAVRDICVTLRKGPYPPNILLVPALVQGAGAEESLCSALRLVNQRPEVDLILFGRGGGAIEDLWCFNAEAVVRAVAASRIPVICGVGHETDFTLTDLVADHRAPTPTGAAELVAAQREEMLRRLALGMLRARHLFTAQFHASRLRYEGLSRRAPLSRPLWIVDSRRQRLDELNARLLRAREVCLTRLQHRLALAAGKLDTLSPLSVLARGFGSVTRLPEGEPILRVSELGEGDRVRVRLSDGNFESRVTRIERSGAGEPGEADTRGRK